MSENLAAVLIMGQGNIKAGETPSEKTETKTYVFVISAEPLYPVLLCSQEAESFL